MATTGPALHRPALHGFARRALCAAVLGLLLPLAAVAAHADSHPRPSIAAVEQQIAALNGQADLAVERYDEARLSLADATRKATTALSRVQAAQAGLDAARRSLAGLLSSAYRNGGSDAFVSLLNSSPQTFLDRSATLDRLAQGRADELAQVATSRHRLAEAQAEAAGQLAVQRKAAGLLAAEKDAIQANLAAQRAVLDGLQADERRRLAAAQAKAFADERAAALLERASRDRQFSYLALGPASGSASVAVQAAYSKLGSPYQWGAAGPDSFDCSGLTMWAWAKAGVSLPHSAAAQYDSGPHVPQSQLQPGDLTFYGSPIHHVGIYIGGGRMISAPKTGDVVKIQDAFRSDYVGASRP